MAKFLEYRNIWNFFNQIKTESDRKEKIYCEDDGEYWICGHVCHKLAIDRYYNNQLKQKTQIIVFSKRQKIKNTNNSTATSALGFLKVVSFN